MDADAAVQQQHGRPRHGYVPDLHMFLPPEEAEGGGATHARLLEVKTALGRTRYTGIAHGDRAVDSRADKLQAEYGRMLHEKDVAWCGTADDAVGPMEAVLQSHGRLRGLVFGAVGEASSDVHGLIRLFAKKMAAAVAGAHGDMASPAQVGRYAWSLRRTIAMSHWRGLATLTLDRKGIIEGGGEEARHGRAAPQRAARGAEETVRAGQRRTAATRGHRRN
jgi:hypothetical protein